MGALGCQTFASTLCKRLRKLENKFIKTTLSPLKNIKLILSNIGLCPYHAQLAHP
jgi:hypothetical protein